MKAAIISVKQGAKRSRTLKKKVYSLEDDVHRHQMKAKNVVFIATERPHLNFKPTQLLGTGV